jgi:CheY-like chemotaxis protein
MIEAKNSVLLVDDDHDLSGLLKEAFTIEGFSVLTAKNGEEALSILKGHSLDQIRTILIDYVMPGMNGVDLTRKIRAMEDTEDIPIYLMTAHQNVNSEVARQGAEDQIEAVIRKPFHDMFAMIEKVTSGERKKK